MKYGTAVSAHVWNDLMRKARLQTNITGQKTKVVATLLSDRAARKLGRKYDYTIMLPEDPFYYRRCALTGPNGKACVMAANYRTHIYHLSRGTTKNTFVIWNFVAEYSQQPTTAKTNRICSQIVTPVQAKDMGFDVSNL